MKDSPREGGAGFKVHVGMEMSVPQAWREDGPSSLHEAGVAAGCLVYLVNGDRKHSRSVLLAHDVGRKMGIFVWAGPAQGYSIRILLA